MSNDDIAWRFRRSARVSDRSVDELIGLCRGILADGRIVQAEAEFLLQWMAANQANCMQWPMNMLYGRLCEMLEDSYFDSSEETELIELLKKFTGGELPPEEIANGGLVVSYSSSLPLDQPIPKIIFSDKSFCFTGEMCFGPRKDCAALVEQLGGKAVNSINKVLNYLVVGHIGSLSWAHSTHGRKIETAVSLRDQGHKVAIIGEQHWVREAQAALEGPH